MCRLSLIISRFARYNTIVSQLFPNSLLSFTESKRLMGFTHVTSRRDFGVKMKGHPGRGIEHDVAQQYLTLYRATGDITYRNKIVQGCLRRIQWVVYNMHDEGTIVPEDLMQEATLGFMNGIERYDVAKATTAKGTIKVANFALTYVKKAIFEYYETHGHNIRIPAQVKRALSQLRKRTKDAIERYGTDNIPVDILYSDKYAFIQEGVISHQNRTNIVDPMAVEDSVSGGVIRDNLDAQHIDQLICDIGEPARSLVLAYYGWGDDSVLDHKKKQPGYSNAVAFQQACFAAGVDAWSGKKIVEQALDKVRVALQLPTYQVEVVEAEYEIGQQLELAF